MTTLAVSRWAAIGTTATVSTADPAALDGATAVVRRAVEELDAAASRFRADSELSAANRAAGRWVPCGPVLLDAVEAAIDVAHRTGGLVDPCLGACLVALGYDRDWTAVAPDGPAPTAVAAPTAAWRAVRIDRRRSRLMVPAGCQLDLGATAKAWCADRAAAAAAATTGSGVLVSLGGDLAVAGEGPAGGWAVRIADDHGAPPSPDDAYVRATVGGLATSSTTVRSWQRGGQPLHHLLDPATGRPAGGPWRTVTVAAASCLHANAASTAAVVLGAGAVAWLDRQSLPARLVAADGSVTTTSAWRSE